MSCLACMKRKWKTVYRTLTQTQSYISCTTSHSDSVETKWDKERQKKYEEPFLCPHYVIATTLPEWFACLPVECKLCSLQMYLWIWVSYVIPWARRMYMYFQMKYIVNVAVKTKGRLLTNKTTNRIRDI